MALDHPLSERIKVQVPSTEHKRSLVDGPDRVEYPRCIFVFQENYADSTICWQTNSWYIVQKRLPMGGGPFHQFLLPHTDIFKLTH